MAPETSVPYHPSRTGRGGPLSVAEMVDSLLLDSDEPVLAQGCVCHTDGAKAYRSLASPLHDGTLAQHASLKLAHTCVKHKPPHPEFTKRIKVDVWNGECFEEQVRLGGTQKLDGFFASFRRVVGKKPLNTVGSCDSQGPRMEQLMHFAVRAFQLKFWFAGCDMFSLYGKLREVARTGDAVVWTCLSAFKVAEDTSLVQNLGEGPNAEVAAVVAEDSPLSELFSED